jgi:hypothetical protein
MQQFSDAQTSFPHIMWTCSSQSAKACSDVFEMLSSKYDLLACRISVLVLLAQVVCATMRRWAFLVADSM